PETSALLLGDRHIEAKENRGGSVNGHGCRNCFKGNAVEELLHVVERIGGHPNSSYFPDRQRGIGIHADLCWEVEGNGKAGLALAEEVAVPRIGLNGGPETGILTHGPEPAAIHRGIDAPGVGVLAWKADRTIGLRVRNRVVIVD